MSFKSNKYEVTSLFIISAILIIAFINYSGMNLQNLSDKNNLEQLDKEEIENTNNIKSQDLAFDDNVTFSGIGKAWNITHWANRTDNALSFSFLNNSYDSSNGVPLGLDWEAYKLKASISDLYDTRNWCNGSFNYGNNDTYALDDDDSIWIENSFQNWTFNKNDVGSYTNNMSGNYLNKTAPLSDNHDCLELRMDGKYFEWKPDEWYYGYGEGDNCSWESTFTIPRGRIIDSELQFDLNPKHLTKFNSWDFSVSLNDSQIYSVGTYTLQKMGEGQWHNFSIPMAVWTNTSRIFTFPMNEKSITIKFALEYNADDAGYEEVFYHITHQQIFFDNVKLITKAELMPSQIGLKMNQTSVKNLTWGKGFIELNATSGNWKGDKIYANYSSNQIGNLSFTSKYFNVDASSTYKIDLKMDSNLFAVKHQPDSNWKEDSTALGTNFLVNNNSVVNWTCYAYMSIPNDYEEPNMTVNFPKDMTIIGVYKPGDTTTNEIGKCSISTQGTLRIPVNQISNARTGFWRIEANSQNYCEQLNISKSGTGNPSDNAWIPSKSFLSGEYIYISAKISNPSTISGYIQQTNATLNFRFPDGTIWTSQTQRKAPDDKGYIYFDYFQIPSNQPNYQAGVYEVIITWNNSHSGHELNETGIIYKTFVVIHDSILQPAQGVYIHEGVVSGSIKNINFEFKDKIDSTAITSDIASVYTFFAGEWINLPMISAGVYLLVFNSSKAKAGSNELTIFADSTYYLNKWINITVVVEKETNLELYLNNENKTTDPFIELPIGDLLNVSVKYTDLAWNHIYGASIQLIGEGLTENLTENSSLKQYSVIINTTEKLSIGVNLLTVVAQGLNFQSKALNTRITIRRLNGEISTTSGDSTITILPGENVDLEISLTDLDYSIPIMNASVRYSWDFGTGSLLDPDEDGIYEDSLENVPEGTYTIIITAFAGDRYDFNSFEITLTATRSPEEFFMFQLLSGIAIASTIVIGGYLVAYQQVLKYPSQVRKVRKYRRTLKRKNPPKTEISSRENLLSKGYKEEIGKTSKLIKEKPKEMKSSPNSENNKLIKL